MDLGAAACDRGRIRPGPGWPSGMSGRSAPDRGTVRLAGPRARPQTRSMDHKTILHEGLRRQREALLAKLDGLPEH